MTDMTKTLFALIALCSSGFVLPSSSWQLVWEDEFEKDTLQSEYWNIADNFTHGNRELQLYVKEQVSVRNGELILTTSTVDKATGPDGKKILEKIQIHVCFSEKSPKKSINWPKIPKNPKIFPNNPTKST